MSTCVECGSDFVQHELTVRGDLMKDDQVIIANGDVSLFECLDCEHRWHEFDGTKLEGE